MAILTNSGRKFHARMITEINKQRCGMLSALVGKATWVDMGYCMPRTWRVTERRARNARRTSGVGPGCAPRTTYVVLKTALVKTDRRSPGVTYGGLAER